MSTNVKPSENNSVTCFGPSKALFTALNNKVLAHNDKYPRAKIKTEKIRQLFAYYMNQGLDFALAKVNLTLQISADVQTGKLTKITPTSNALALNKLAEIKLEISVSPEQIQAAKNELVELKLDNVKAEDLYFEAFETHAPSWNRLI